MAGGEGQARRGDPEARRVQGHAGIVGRQLADALDTANRVAKDFAEVYLYASLISDQDTRVSKYQGMQQEMQQLGAKFGEETAFIEPEILKIDKATLDKLIARSRGSRPTGSISTTSSAAPRTR